MTSPRERSCRVEGCFGQTLARGYCNRHYQRWLKYGDPDITLQLRGASAAERLEHYSEWRGECLIWTAGTDRDGYGLTYDGHDRVRAHRAAYSLAHGAIPDGMVVRHTCDTPSCINAAHLELGTNRDNVRDRSVRGRSCMGEDSHLAKLTADDVREIRRLRSAGVLQSVVASQFGVSDNHVSVIVRRLAWKHIERSDV